MKKLFCVLLALAMLALCACGDQTSDNAPETTGTPSYSATDADVAQLEKLYEGRSVYHADTHVHTSSGGNSDGKVEIKEWPGKIKAAGIDFVAIMDHSQTLHMKSEVWDNSIFLGGAETGALVMSVDGNKGAQKLHTLYLFAELDQFEAFLNAHPMRFFYSGDLFKSYGNKTTFSREEMAELVTSAYDHGGFFVFAHPLLEDYSPTSGELLDLWFADGSGFEVLYGYAEKHELAEKMAYNAWVELLGLGKRIYATAGSDTHSDPRNTALSTFYSTEKNAVNFLEYMRAGDFNPGPVGVRMCIGDTTMGGQTSFEGQRVAFSVGDYHNSVRLKHQNFRAVLCDESGQVFSQEFAYGDTVYFAVDAAADADFYRVEIYDAKTDEMIALGNPIWNNQ